MNIEDLIKILSNRLREFKLSRDYARMSGDLERMNVADKEVLALEDTLYKLNLLVDTSKSAAVKEEILAEVITDGSVAVLGEYDITPYATDPLHEEKVMTILSRMGMMDTAEKIDGYIKGKYPSSPVTGEMIESAALAYAVDERLMMAIMEQDSRFGTAGLAVSTLNPGNVGNDDDGNTRTYGSWQEGVTAVAEWLSRHRISEEVPPEAIVEPVATSTPSFIAPISTTTAPVIATPTPITTVSTTTTATTTTPTAATPTPITTVSTTTTATTTTPVMATSTPTTATSTPTTATSAEAVIPVVSSTTTAATSTTTDATTTTPVTSTPVEEAIPAITTTTPSVTTDSTSSPQTSLEQEVTAPETATTTAN